VAKVILVGTDVALLEGLAQTLIGFGHDVSFAATVAEAAGSLTGDLPAMAVVSSGALEEGGAGMTLPLTPGGALIIYGTSQRPAVSPDQASARDARASRSAAGAPQAVGAGAVVRPTVADYRSIDTRRAGRRLPDSGLIALPG
jgi:hypothetical protein